MVFPVQKVADQFQRCGVYSVHKVGGLDLIVACACVVSDCVIRISPKPCVFWMFCKMVYFIVYALFIRFACCYFLSLLACDLAFPCRLCYTGGGQMAGSNRLRFGSLGSLCCGRLRGAYFFTAWEWLLG